MGNENDTPTSDLENPESVNPVENEAASAPEGDEAAVVADVATLQAEIEALKAQLDDAKDQSLRAAAEAQNTRHRAQQDVEKAHKYALEKFVGDLLPVADNLERALAAMDKTAEGVAPVVEGVELTLKTLVDALGRHQVEAIDPAGQPFDPQLHQAMTMVPNPDLEPNTVMDVFQKGYQLNGRLVRPAMVVVSKAAD